MQINEIFRSISGESIQAGKLAIFIRTQHCPLTCSYCDTTYALSGDNYTIMSVDEILRFIEQWSTKYVVFTGGEPLIQPDAFELVAKLIELGYHVEVETCGAVDISDVVGTAGVTVTMDWKCPSSNMTSKMLETNLKLLTKDDVLKCVVGSEEDLNEMKRVSCLTRAQVFVSPVFGNIEPKEIVHYLEDNNLDNVRFQLQIHKYVWDKDMKGV